MEKSMTAWQMLLFIAKFFGTYLLYKSFKAKSYTYAILNFTAQAGEKKVKCLKNKDISVTSTSAEYTGAFIDIIPAKTARNQLFPLLSPLFIFN